MPPGLVRALAVRIAGDQPLLKLLGRVEVMQGATAFRVSTGDARLLAFLAMQPGGNDRRFTAGTLWPDVDDARAAGNLRSALWRLNALPMELINVERTSVSLRQDVLVDVRLLGDWAARIISGERLDDDLRHTPWDLGGLELLPGWQDDWLLLERERIRQRLMHGLECMAVELIQQGRYPEAIEVALIAVSADGLRESAQRVLIEAHLAERNWVEAWRCFDEHRAHLWRELGVEPSRQMVALLTAAADTGSRRAAAARRDGTEIGLTRQERNETSVQRTADRVATA